MVNRVRRRPSRLTRSVPQGMVTRGVPARDGLRDERVQQFGSASDRRTGFRYRNMLAQRESPILPKVGLSLLRGGNSNDGYS